MAKTKKINQKSKAVKPGLLENKTVIDKIAGNKTEQNKSVKNKTIGKKTTHNKSKLNKSSVANKIETEDIEIDDLTKVYEPEVLDAESQQLASALPPEMKIEDNWAPDTSLLPADPTARYMAEIRKYPLLSREDEYKLAVQYRETGDREVAQKLVTSNLRFVVKVALEYSKFGAKLIDLIQEGNIGLMQAVKDFNPYKGVRLITYAVWWIRGYIQDYLLRHYSMVRIGTTHTQRKLFYELQRSRDQLERMGMDTGLMQISGRLGIPEADVKKMSERVFQRDVSLDKPVSINDKSTMQDFTSDGDVLTADVMMEQNEQVQILKDNIDRLKPDLNEREVFLLENRLLSDEPKTLQEIGDKYGITREAARQMEARLIDKLKKQML
jgi:RNA polymerase sigma-32 factor